MSAIASIAQGEDWCDPSVVAGGGSAEGRRGGDYKQGLLRGVSGEQCYDFTIIGLTKKQVFVILRESSTEESRSK